MERGKREEEGHKPWRSRRSSVGRELSAEEAARLAADDVLVPEFRRRKLEAEARANWDRFYNRNAANFFKDRHWSAEEFAQLLPDVDLARGIRLLEAGCGVGNFVLPFLQAFPASSAVACDFSDKAVRLLGQAEGFDGGRCSAFVADLTEEGGAALRDGVGADATVDVATLVFVLSSVHPDKMPQALANVARTLRPGGSVVVRDYGLHDHAQLRFQKGKRLGDRFYARQDGTRAFYFTLEDLRRLALETGLEPVDLHFLHRNTLNRKLGLDVPRVFVQARLRKPL